MLQKRIVLAGFAAAVMLISTACRAADPVIVGYVGDLSGACGPYSEANLRATKMAVEEINASGGVLGRTIELKVRDSKTNPEEATKQARESFVVDKADILTGSCSSAVMLAQAAVAKEYKKLFWNSIGTTHRANIDFANAHVYQALANSLMEGRALAEYAAAQKDWKKIATIGLDYEWPRMTIDNFVKRLKELRPEVQITTSVWPKLGESNLSAYIPVLLNDNPDVILGVIFGGATTNFFRQGKTYGMLERAKVFTYLSTYALMDPKSEVPEGVYGWTRSPFYVRSPQMDKFVAKYQAMYKAYPFDEAIAGYDTMIQIGEAIKRANSLESSKLVDALVAMEHQGVRGDIKVRRLDIQAYAPTYIGVSKKTSEYPFQILTDLVRVGGDRVMPTEAEVQAMRAAAK